jgi:hypothetical protein
MYCKDCKHWEHWGGTWKWGKCPRLDDDESLLDVSEGGWDPPHPYIETNQYFGCIHFEPKEKVSLTIKPIQEWTAVDLEKVAHPKPMREYYPRLEELRRDLLKDKA